MTKLICLVFGHKWLYNFPSLPDKCICKRCGEKKIYDYQKMSWTHTDSFNQLGTDKEVIKRWKKYKQ